MFIIKIQSQLRVSARIKPCSGRTQLYVAKHLWIVFADSANIAVFIPTNRVFR